MYASISRTAAILGFAAFATCASASMVQAADFTRDGVRFSPQEIDRIMVLENMNVREQDSLRLAAVAYSVHNADVLFNEHPEKTGICPVGAPNTFYDQNSDKIYSGITALSPATLNEVAERKAAQLRGETLRGSTVDAAADFSADALALGAGGRGGGLIKLLYPPTKQMVVRYLEKDPRTPNLSKDFAIEWSSWAYEQVRSGTPAGKALANYVKEFNNNDPTKDRSMSEPVKKAEQKLLLIKATHNSQEALDKLNSVTELDHNLSDGIGSIRDILANREAKEIAAAAEKQKLLDKVKVYQNIAGSLQLTSYLFEIAGDAKAARTAGALSNAAGGVANLIQNAGTMAPMMLAAGYVGIAVAVVSAIQSSKEQPNPWPALFAMLQHISEQIENLRFDVMNSLAKIDAKFSALLGQNIQIAKSTQYNVLQLRQAIAQLRNQIGEMNESLSEQIASDAGLTLRREDRWCFRWTGDRRLRPLDRDAFIICRDTYVDRATIVAKDALGSASADSVATTPFGFSAVAFPAAEYYNSLRSEVSPDNTKKLANPSAWFRGASLLVSLIRSSPEHFRDIDLSPSAVSPNSCTLDPVIQGGNDLKDFIGSLAVVSDADGYHLRRSRFIGIIEHLAKLQVAALDKIEDQVAHPEIKADVTAGKNLRPNIDFPYKMLAEQGIRLCKDVKPNVVSVGTVSATRSGGAHGTDEVYSQKSLDSLPFWRRLKLRDVIEGAVRGFDFKKISFDKSVILAIDPSVVLMEQIKHHNAEMSFCVSRFDITDMNITHQMQATVGYDIRLKVFLTVEGKENNQTLLVQELELDPAKAHAVTRFYHLFYDGAARPQFAIAEAWNQVFRGHFHEVFRTAKNDEADQNRTKVQNEMNKLLEREQLNIYRAANESIAHEISEFQQERAQLIALSQVGLNTDHPAVRHWLSFIQGQRTIVSIEEFLANRVLHGDSNAELQKSIVVSRNAIIAQVDILRSYKELEPHPDAISARLNDLYKIKAERIALKPLPSRQRPTDAPSSEPCQWQAASGNR